MRFAGREEANFAEVCRQATGKALHAPDAVLNELASVNEVALILRSIYQVDVFVVRSSLPYFLYLLRLKRKKLIILRSQLLFPHSTGCLSAQCWESAPTGGS